MLGAEEAIDRLSPDELRQVACRAEERPDTSGAKRVRAEVLHLQTAAIGAEAHYRRFPDAHRPETPEQSVPIHRDCAPMRGGGIPVMC